MEPGRAFMEIEEWAGLNWGEVNWDLGSYMVRLERG